MMLTEKGKKNFKEAIKDLEASISKEQKELFTAAKCWEYMHSNYYDAGIEKEIVRIIKFYLNDLKELFRQHCDEMDAYKHVLKKGEI